MSARKRYTIAGRSAATLATATHAAAALWNPSAAGIRLFVKEIAWAKTVATADNFGLIRITARGTPGSTVTPSATSDYELGPVTPPSGALLDLAAYSVQPTLNGTNYLRRDNLPASIGAKFTWFFDDLEVGAGTGIAIVTPAAVILQPGDVTFVWEEI